MEATIELKHLHEHPLIAGEHTNGDERTSCSGCFDDILPGSIFICSESHQQQCKFVLHKLCGLLPKKITNFLHTRHPLTLYPKTSYAIGFSECDSCRNVIEGFVYHCPICAFDLHVRCAQALLSDAQEQRDKQINWRSRGELETEEGESLEMELRHPFHEHPLKLISQPIVEDTKQHNNKCDGCLAPILCLTSFYSCNSSNNGCEFFLHKSCAKMPAIITTHPSHTAHPLTLLEKHPCVANYANCDACGDPIKGFLYHCSVCGHNLDTTCASAESRRFGQKDHNHTFIELWAAPALFTCDICGVQSKGKSLLCTICQVRLHGKCASLPHFVKIDGHRHHPLKLTFGSQMEQPFDTVKHSCAICSWDVNTTYGFYYCTKCKYIADLECGTSEAHRDPQFNPNTFDEFEEVELDNNSEVVRDDDSHRKLHSHGLILCGEDEDDELEIPRKCRRCWSVISARFYRCLQNCGCFYHESCATLPNRIYHPLHDHQLIFQRRRGRPFKCEACGLISNAPHYWCGECDFELDVECSLRSKSIEIEKAHEHPLRLVREPYNCKRKCRGCSLECDTTKYRCAERECDYNVCFKCIGMPTSFKHPWDEHPLELTYESVENEEYYCDQCEAPRDPHHWFYHCRICERDVHPQWPCMKRHNLDLEKIYQWNEEYHNPHHTFTAGANPQVDPTCGRCGFPCKDFYAQCTDCKYCIHWSKCELPK